MNPLLLLEPGDYVQESGYGTTIVSMVKTVPFEKNGSIHFTTVTEKGNEIEYIAGGTYGAKVIPKNIIKYEQGDIFENFKKHDVFIHQANCHNRIKTGVAAGVNKHMMPLVLADNLTKAGDPRKLGTFSTATIDNTIGINLYGQFYYERDSLQTNYNAIIKALKAINILYAGLSICMPCIGSGLGGGSWDTVSQLINICLKDCNVTVYLFEE